MHILAFDTCLGAVSVAVARTEANGLSVLLERSERRQTGHAERLLPMLVEALEALNLTFASIGRIAVTRGPGSFTGVRTGIAAARALALAIGCPAVGVGCLAAIAWEARARPGEKIAQRPLAVALDARLGMVYFQLFEATGEPRNPALLLPAQACAERLGRTPAVIVGSAAALVEQAVVALGGCAEARLPEVEPRAGAVAQLGAMLACEEPLKPLYLRPPDVKPQSGGVLPRIEPQC
jgi:tRNA threonylcarbamoyladenosine biosynthesis protein TsaB